MSFVSGFTTGMGVIVAIGVVFLVFLFLKMLFEAIEGFATVRMSVNFGIAGALAYLVGMFTGDWLMKNLGLAAIVFSAFLFVVSNTKEFY